MGMDLHRSWPHTRISKMMKLVLLCALVGVAMSQLSTSTCRYWCKNPQGQAYCCENVNQAPSPVVGTKRGTCPYVRPDCPPTRFFGGPPRTCSNDSSCPGIDKCCYDTCLAEHVCKQPQYGGFGQGGFGQGGLVGGLLGGAFG